MRPLISTLCLALSCFAAEPLAAVELKQETSKAFGRYIVLTEERMARSLRDGDSFYSMDGKPELQREALRIRLRQGEIIIDQMETLDGERTIKMPGGLVHHWIALGFIPGVNLNQALALLQDYEQYPVIYQPDVKRSKLLSTDGTHFNIYLRLYQKTIVTAIFNAEFEVTYFRVDERRANSRSYSKRIAEVENPDQPEERERPVGNDRGFLWRLYSYWRLEERDGGVYVELESVGLSRSVPVFFAWFVNPLLKSLPKSYLSRVLNSTRTALTKSRLTYRIHEEGATDSFEARCSGRVLEHLKYCCLLSNVPAERGAQPMAESAAKLRPFTKVSKAHRSEPFRSVRSLWFLETETNEYAIWVAGRQGFRRGRPMQMAKWQVELTNCRVPLRSRPVV
jgi:hypothetical protein